MVIISLWLCRHAQVYSKSLREQGHVTGLPVSMVSNMSAVESEEVQKHNTLPVYRRTMLPLNHKSYSAFCTTFEFYQASIIFMNELTCVSPSLCTNMHVWVLNCVLNRKYSV